MTPFVSDPDFTLFVGDVRETLLELADESVHCVVTSPPYWGLRDYGTGEWDGGDLDCDHLQHVGGPQTDSPTFRATAREERREKQFGSVCAKCGATRVDRQLGLEVTPDLYVEEMVAVFREVRRVLRKDGTVWLNLGDSYVGKSSGGWGDSHSTLRAGRLYDGTALVARRLGRRSIGIELNPEYAQLAARRLSQPSLLAEEPAA